MYEKTAEFIVRMSDIAWIPKNPDNSDYQRFLEYLEDNKLTIDDIPDYKLE